jgi:hypothetical protein
MRVSRLIPVALAGAGWLTILALVGPVAWPLLILWLLALALVIWIWSRVPSVMRIALALVFILLCALLTWEGGLFFLPAALALAVLEVSRRCATRRRLRHAVG